MFDKTSFFKAGPLLMAKERTHPAWRGIKKPDKLLQGREGYLLTDWNSLSPKEKEEESRRTLYGSWELFTKGSPRKEIRREIGIAEQACTGKLIEMQEWEIYFYHKGRQNWEYLTFCSGFPKENPRVWLVNRGLHPFWKTSS